MPKLRPLSAAEVCKILVDNKGRKLIPNPAHGGEQMTEEY